ncbi:MAG: hypothetical protein ACI4OT_01795 [Bacilli bacterium]
MKKLLIDIDEVICENGFVEALNKFKNTNYKLDDFKNYLIEDFLDSDEKEAFYDFFLERDSYENVNLIKDSIEVIKELNEVCDIYLYSACIMYGRENNCGRIFSDKYNFIIKYLPFIDPKKIIFTNTKNLFLGDIQIDDKLSNLEGPIKLKLLFTAYHNKEIDDKTLKEKNIIRVNNWQDVKKIVLNYINE